MEAAAQQERLGARRDEDRGASTIALVVVEVTILDKEQAALHSHRAAGVRRLVVMQLAALHEDLSVNHANRTTESRPAVTAG